MIQRPGAVKCKYIDFQNGRFVFTREDTELKLQVFKEVQKYHSGEALLCAADGAERLYKIDPYKVPPQKILMPVMEGGCVFSQDEVPPRAQYGQREYRFVDYEVARAVYVYRERPDQSEYEVKMHKMGAKIDKQAQEIKALKKLNISQYNRITNARHEMEENF